MATLSLYPESASERDRWIVHRRGPRAQVHAERPYAFHTEQERSANGDLVDVATIFLTNRECPWHCVMCDLWQNTLPGSVAPGDIPRQIEYALARLPRGRQVKLYNAGSFFDPRAIPTDDHGAIAALLQPFERVIVECHPSLVGPGCFAFKERISATLEVAMGLETANPEVLQKLNKRMTLEQYGSAAALLSQRGIALRSFVLCQPPFMAPEESVLWASRSIDFAQKCGATAVSLIATRGGNGAMEELAMAGEFTPPTLATVEDALDYGLGCAAGRVFVDLWDLERFASCPDCRNPRLERLRRINLSQRPESRLACDTCGGRS